MHKGSWYRLFLLVSLFALNFLTALSDRTFCELLGSEAVHRHGYSCQGSTHTYIQQEVECRYECCLDSLAFLRKLPCTTRNVALADNECELAMYPLLCFN